MIYAIVNTKGGVGKTTVAVHLATMLARDGATLLIDGDPQASAASWAAWRRESNVSEKSPTTVILAGRAIFAEGKMLAQNYANTVIDAGGRDAPGIRSALLLAQRAIIPVGASNLDAAAMDDLLEIIEEARQFNESLQIKVLLTRVANSNDTGKMIDWLEQKGLPLMQARICERVAIKRAVGDGAIVQEISDNKKAIFEMEFFYKEIKNEK